MSGLIRCVLCKDHNVPVSILICPYCRRRETVDPKLEERVRSELQQHRMVAPFPFEDTRRCKDRLRLVARAAGFEPVYGDAVVRMVVHDSTRFGTDTVTAFRTLVAFMQGIAFGEHTNVVSSEVSLLHTGNRWTTVEVRALLDDEQIGIGGVAR